MTLSDWTARAGAALRTFTPRKFIANPDHDFFLVSYPRSGNTWLRSMIGQLLTGKKVVSLRELDYVVPDIYFDVPVSRVVEMPFHVVKSHERYSYGAAAAKYRNVIYIVRDPRDVAVSYYRYLINNGGKHKTLNEFVSDWVSGRILAGSWQEHVESWTHESGLPREARINVVKYEDVVNNPVSALGQIAQFLCLETRDGSLTRVAQECAIEEMRAKEQQGNRPINETGRQYFIGEGKWGGWKEKLSAESAEEIIQFAGRTMRRFGYV